ncbi:translocation/assembly module TamB domain-containing protein [Thiofilum flexile]|uniref:translocation/assembly module TamB domain-containing protein n=1 Tax=Thiofilum flexile TaxID=125627 RepID=UPI000368F506|nr:translocation/assembly module TamB domain-containing protein [Thiofilum flexile]
MKLSRSLIWTPLLAVIVLIVLVLLLVGFLVFSQAGARLVAQQLEQRVAGLTFEGVEGALGGDLKAKRIYWQEEGIEASVTVEGLDLNTKLGLRPELKRTYMDRLIIKTPPAGPGPVVIPELSDPLEALLSDVRVKEFEFWVGASALKLYDVSIKANNAAGMLYVQELSARTHANPNQGLMLNLQGQMALGALHTGEFNGRVASVDPNLGIGTLDLNITGPDNAYKIAGQGQWSYRNSPRYTVKILGSGNMEQLNIYKLTLTDPEGGSEGQAKGYLNWYDPILWQLDMTTHGVDLADYGVSTPTSLDSHIVWSGERSQVKRSTHWAIHSLTGQVQNYPVRATGEVLSEFGVFEVRSLDAALGDNKLTIVGKADQDLAMDWSLNAPKLAQISPQLSGALKGNGALQGRLDGSQLTVDIQDLSGHLQGYKLKATGQLARNNNTLSARNVRVYMGDNVLTLDGDARDDLGLVWTLDAKNLTQLKPTLKGNISGSGRIEGQLDKKHLDLHIDGLKGQINQLPIQAQGQLKLQDDILSAQDMQVFVGTNRLTFDGSSAANTLGLNWQLEADKLSTLHPKLKGNLSASGNVKGLMDGSEFDLSIAKMRGTLQDYPIQGTGQLSLKNKALSAKDVILTLGDNKLILNGSAAETLGLDWQLEAKALKQLHLKLKGQVSAEGNLKGLIDGSQLDIAIQRLKGNVQDIPLEAKGLLHFENKVLEARNLVIDTGKNQITLDGSAGDSLGLDWKVSANDLGQLSPKLTGKLNGQGTLKGTLDGSQLDISIGRLEGKINQYPINAKGQLARRDQVYSARDLVVNVGDNQLVLNGNAGDALGLDWRINASRLEQLSPKLQGNAEGSGTLTGALDGSRLDVTIKRLTGKVQGYPLNVSGGLKRQGDAITARDLVVESGKNRVILNGSATDSAGVSWQVELKDLSQIKPNLTGRVQGRGRLQGLLDGSRLDVSIQALEGQVLQYPLTATGQIGLRDKQLSAKDLAINLGQNRIVLNGQASNRLGVNWSLEAKNLSQIHPELQGNLQGNGRIEGAVDGSTLTLSISQLNGQLREYPLSARGSITRRNNVFNTEGFSVDVGQNRLLLSGQVSDRVSVRWQLDGRNLSQLHPSLKGNLKGRGSLTSRRDGSNLSVDIEQLTGQLNGYPLDATGQIAQQGKDWIVKQGRVRAGSNALQLSGKVTEPIDVQWRIDAKQLSQVLPGLAGSIQGQGTAKGKWSLPQVQGQVQGTQLRYQDLSIESLVADIGQSGGQYRANATLRGIRQGDNVVSQAVLEAQGTPENHRVRVSAIHKEGKIDLSAVGRWQNNVWAGNIQSADLRDTAAGNWRLIRPVTMQVSNKQLASGEICLSNGQGNICAQPAISSSGVAATGRIQNMPLVMLKPWLPENIKLAGSVDGSYQVVWRKGQGSGQAKLRFPDNTVQIRQTNGQFEQYTYHNAQVVITLVGKTVSLQGQTQVDPYGAVKLNGRIDLVEQGDPRIQAVISAESPNVAWLEKMTPDLGEIKGQVQLEVEVVGTLSKPTLRGIARLQNGQAYLSETGALLQDINLTVRTVDARNATITGSLRAGSGVLQAKGTMQFGNLPKWSADVQLQGERLLLMDTHEIQAWASPNLRVTAVPGTVNIQGSIFIPEMVVSLRELPSSASVRSDDVVIVGRRAQANSDVVIVGRRGQSRTSRVAQAPQGGNLPGAGRPNLQTQDEPLNINPDVTIELGDRAVFSGFGLDAKMRGRLRIARTRQDIIGLGTLSIVDGVYKAYGQNLRIERGRLIFNGNLENPGLDVQAVRTIEDDTDIKVGITLNGTVRRPESTLFSSPTQTQSDTLSYLLTGHSASTLSGSDTNVLRQAIMNLGITGGESIANQLGVALGLDEVGINTKGDDYRESELLLGKRLGPRLYVKYIVGVFDSLQRVAITYQINKRLQLEAQSGRKQGVDFIYKINTDKGPFRRSNR